MTHIHPEGSYSRHSVLLVNVWLQHRTLAFPKGTSVKDSFLNFLNISESNHQDTSSESQIDETHFCKIGVVWQMFMTLPLKLLQQGCYLLVCGGSWHHATVIFLVLWRSILVVTVAKLNVGVPEALQVVLFTQPTVLCWRHTLPDNMWQMNEPTGWLER
jgi:hypothetical protein